jgi:hypothetical protein
MRTKDRIDKDTDRLIDRQTCAMENDPFKSEVDSLEGKQAGMQCDCTQGFPGNNRAAECGARVRAAWISSST